MTTLAERPNAALLVIDVQNGVMAEAHERDRVIDNIAHLVERARDQQVPVIWVQHHDDDLERGSEAWQCVPELRLGEAEPVVHKQYGDSFEATDLESCLTDLGVGRLFVTGAQTDACIRSTIHGAFTRGYDTILVADAHTTEDLSAYGLPTPDQVIAHVNTYWRWQRGPGRAADVIDTADVDFTPP